MLKVFLVEDESVIREGLRDNIPWQQYGYQFVGEAGDGEMALPLIRKTKPDVLITDIKMPFMDGLSLSKIVASEFPKTKIIIISGYDDFEYARQAIEVGVEQYLLKPITRMTLKKVLLELKEKIEQEQEQKDYQLQFQSEMHEYEQFSRRHFFEKMFEGELSVKEIYEEAAKLEIDLSASCFNLIFFYLQEKNTDDTDMEELIRKQDEILHYFLRHPQYVVFSWNVNSYGILIKSETAHMEELAQKSIEYVKQAFAALEDKYIWYIAIGNPVERLSMLPTCYQEVNHYFAYRFILPNQHILTKVSLNGFLNRQEEKADIAKIDSSKMNPEILKDFLERGHSSEIHDFVETYLQSINDALQSNMFRDYIVLHIRFTTLAYMENLGINKEEYADILDKQMQDMHMEPGDVAGYFIDMLETAISIRERENDDQSKKVLRKALEYIDANFDKEDLSLNSVAGNIHVSANYFSAIFSQTMQKTFIEYVTGKRMDKAKKLLKTTELSSGEIAQGVGYKDPHYFSFVFKKTQGCSPREYRANTNRSV